MKRRNVVRSSLAGLVMMAFQGCGTAESDPGTAGTAEVEVELFAPGVVSSAEPEFATTFSASGDTVFFNRTPPDRSRLDLMMSVATDEGWSDPVPYPPLSGVSAIDPFVSLDGSTLYVSTDLPRPGAPAGEFNLWRLSLADPERDPEPLPEPINSDSSDVFNSLARDGTMVFSSRRDGERRIYEVRLGEADGPRLLTLGSGEPASNPAIHPDGDLLVFARSAPGAPPDLFVACRQGEGWGDPIRLPEPINGPFTEFAPGFGPGHLYFTSERPGVVPAGEEGERPPGDVYRTPLRPVEAFCAADARPSEAGPGDDDPTSEAAAAAGRILDGARRALGAGPDRHVLADARVTGPDGTFETRVRSAPDGRARMEQPHADFLAGIGPTGGWQVDTATGRPGADASIVPYVRGHELHALALDPRSRLHGPLRMPVETFAGEEALRVRMSMETGEGVQIFFGPSDTVPLGLRLVWMEPGVEVTWSDWREVDGVRLFHRARFRQGDEIYVYRYDRVELAPLPDSAYDAPDRVGT